MKQLQCESHGTWVLWGRVICLSDPFSVGPSKKEGGVWFRIQTTVLYPISQTISGNDTGSSKDMMRLEFLSDSQYLPGMVQYLGTQECR